MLSTVHKSSDASAQMAPAIEVQDPSSMQLDVDG